MAKILFVVNNPDFFVSHRLPIGVAALARGHDVHVAAADGDGVTAIAREGMTFHRIPLRRSSARPWEELLSVRSLLRLYRTLEPDLAHHVTIKPVLYGGLASRLCDVPAVVHAVSGLGYVFLSRGPVASARRVVARAAYRVAFRHRNVRVIFQNEFDRAAFVDRGLVRPDDTVLIRGSGVDLSLFRPGPEPEGVFTVVFPGRMLVDKGVRELVQASRLLRARGVVVRIRLIGPTDRGNPATINEAELRRWEREGLVDWLGERTDMPEQLRSAHAVCLPSYREGLSKALIEAAAAGRPIVTTDTPGCRDVVRDGENGLLVPIKDPEAIARALARLADHPSLRVAMGARGRDIAVAEFSVGSVVDQTLRMYEQLLARSSRRR